MFGTKLFRSLSEVTACCSSTSALIAVTASGTSWRFSARRRAVTTISASPSAADGGGCSVSAREPAAALQRRLR